MSFANNTPVHFLPGIGTRTAQVLHDLEIHTAGQLKKMPEKVMIELFGPSITSVLNVLEVKSIQKIHQKKQTVPLPIAKSKKSLVQRLRLASQFVMML